MTAVPSPCRFWKMHGAGNDFVVLDLRGGRPAPEAAERRRIADRHTGVGCDQLIAVTDPQSADAVAGYRIWNTDGGSAGQCGNGARCVAAWLARHGGVDAPAFRLDAPSGPVTVQRLDEGRWRLGMGRPRLAAPEIPWTGGGDTRAVALDVQGIRVEAGLVSMGNPHAVLEVEDVEAVSVARLGAALQADPRFPDSVNVGFAQVLGPAHLRLRVYERGVGETRACGSGACAAVVALVRRGRIGRREVAVDLPGGRLVIDWPDDGAGVEMAGPAEFVFEGEWLA